MSQHIMDRGDSSMQHTNAIKKTLKENAGSQANDACNFFFDYTLPQEERLKKFAEVFPLILRKKLRQLHLRKQDQVSPMLP